MLWRLCRKTKCVLAVFQFFDSLSLQPIEHLIWASMSAPKSEAPTQVLEMVLGSDDVTCAQRRVG